MKTQNTIPLSVAESTLHSIAQREGEKIRKRRSQPLIERFGLGYQVTDPETRLILEGGGPGIENQDGRGATLEDLAERYRDCEGNTPRQRAVLAAILEGAVE